MKVTVKEFTELTLDELYDLLRLRNKVFVVEQECIYQDIDGKDQKALHALGKYKNQIVAYARLFAPGDYFNEAAIGRVVVAKESRKNRLGEHIMQASIKAVENKYKTRSIRLAAQCHLTSFYESLGFQTAGAEFLEDGMPHIEMVKIA